MVRFSLAALPALRLPTGLYCYDVDFADRSMLRGESVRYSLMVLLGLQRATHAGCNAGDLDALWEACLAARREFAPGDFGLALWAGQRREGDRAAELVTGLGQAIADRDALTPLVGMEIGWLVVGLAQAMTAGVAGAEPLLDRVVVELDRRRAASGLYLHHGSAGTRRRLPNFATEIYTLLALATLARGKLDDTAGEKAVVLADKLLELQLPDGGWPWLFDAERGTVVERYEIYSVHQDAMAPMALIETYEFTGDRRYLDAAVAGVPWSHGHNELGVDLFDVPNGFAHRAIRRRTPWHKAALAANSLGAVTTGLRPLDRSPVELNTTCRPYHLGWILEAWAGRQDLAGGGS